MLKELGAAVFLACLRLPLFFLYRHQWRLWTPLFSSGLGQLARRRLYPGLFLLQKGKVGTRSISGGSRARSRAAHRRSICLGDILVLLNLANNSDQIAVLLDHAVRPPILATRAFRRTGAQEPAKVSEIPKWTEDIQ
ncbi:hypothetical protein BR93DRAFT_362311 [Coniochaeta sp. PMI_546]|nr:hypothetical protein BR93DRAFT_362311 [Coniochaeta sp. PMI_546]